jgi:Zn-dependent membrane protease YugP
MFFWDPTFIFLIPAMLLVFWAQYRVRNTFAEYSNIPTRSGVTAAQVAQDILRKNNINDVSVEQVPGDLTDHYDPKAKAVRLSASTYNSTSIAAIGVAAHEVGHAIQHDVAYIPLHMRNLIFPVARIGDMAGPFIVILGFFFNRSSPTFGMAIIDFGILIFTLAVAFYIITLPVEFNASSRAVAILDTGGYMTREEVQGARKVLNAAALTYVAAAAASVSQLVRLLFLRNAARNRD